MQRRGDWIKKLELKILSKRNLVPDIVLFIRGEEKFHGKLNAISREENYLRLGPKTLEWFPLCPFISPRVPFDQEKIDRSNFSLFLFFFFLSLSPRVVSCTFNVLSPKIYIYTLCLPEFHNHHLFRFLRFHSRSQRGWGNGSYPIVKKRMDNCLQFITKFPRDVKTRACVTPRKNFADGDGIMENTGSEIREREVDRSEVKEKKKL